MEIVFTLNSLAVEQRLARIINGYLSFEVPLRSVRDYKTREIDRQFETEGSNIGSRWKPLAASTVMNRLALGYGAGPILNRTGSLKRSIHLNKLTRNEVSLKSDSQYFAFHQVGGPKIPQRQMLGFSEKMQDDIVNIVQKYITNLVNNG